ncbi:hypothetical protein V2I59_07680 [Pseudomonas viridiflava]|uniref:hypothetical protein n=1 Tax=Pseudomonas viridiflava TaxID=33069 RepID=UPI002EAF3BE9|nr:hypothetical protein [Pseudomonas viridiflava]MEE4104135.1 hypothetical protein [Pseudomonas viridiflava]
MEPVPAGSKFYYTSSNGGSSVIIKPADNVSGVIIRTGIFSAQYGAVVSTGTSIPLYINDVKEVLMAIVASAVPHQFQYPIYLPPGFGLWTFGKNGGVIANITYDLL